MDLDLDLKLGWHDRNDVDEEAGRYERNRGNLGWTWRGRT